MTRFIYQQVFIFQNLHSIFSRSRSSVCGLPKSNRHAACVPAVGSALLPHVLHHWPRLSGRSFSIGQASHSATPPLPMRLRLFCFLGAVNSSACVWVGLSIYSNSPRISCNQHRGRFDVNSLRLMGWELTNTT